MDTILSTVLILIVGLVASLSLFRILFISIEILWNLLEHGSQIQVHHQEMCVYVCQTSVQAEDLQMVLSLQ